MKMSGRCALSFSDCRYYSLLILYFFFIMHHGTALLLGLMFDITWGNMVTGSQAHGGLASALWVARCKSCPASLTQIDGEG